MTLATARASSMLAIAVLFAACAGPAEEGDQTSSLEQAPSVAAGLPMPPPPPDDPVFRQCLLDALKDHPECLMRENTGPACSMARAAAVRACSPPPPERARDRCVAEAREAFNQCVRANPDQRQACSDRFAAADRACRAPTTPPTGSTPPPPPPPPPVAN